MKKIILCLLYTSLSLYCFAQQAVLDSIFKNGKVTGVQLVATIGQQTQNYYYGKSSAEEPAMVDSATIFQAASLSKCILAYIVLRMADNRQISLDEPLRTYFNYDRTRADTAASRITARMVLHHQTGFPNWAVNPVSKQWFTSALHTQFAPGSSWSYSGEGFMYLQYAVESIWKESLEKIARREVFMPLDMHSSSFLWQPAFSETGAYGHNKNGEVTGRNEPFLTAAAYSMLTTASDYNKFLQALVQGKGLSRKAHRLMFADTVNVRKKDKAPGDAAAHVSWALGMGIQRNELGTAIWHWGDNGDFKCFFMAFPEKNKSIVYFTNSENGLKVMPAVLDFYFGRHTWWALQWLDKDF